MTWTLLSLPIAALAAAGPESPSVHEQSAAPGVAAQFSAVASTNFAFDPAAFVPALLASSNLSLPGAPANWPSQDQSPASLPAAADGSNLQPTTLPAAESAIENRFFKTGSRRWQITGAAATQFDDHFALVGVAVSYFIERDFTIDFELNGMYYVQDEGEDTPGINVGMQLRWHFMHDQSHGDNPHWTIYADAGLGVLVTADNVPEGGKQFNLTPQVGAGISWLLDESSDTRLLTGIRWHHTSNANTHENNPGANKIMLYAGLNFPF
jgi:hypothetical protein